MTSTEVLNLTDEATRAGVNSEDWDALLEWIARIKGSDVAEAFSKRCERPI